MDDTKTNLDAYRMARTEEQIQKPGYKAGKNSEIKLSLWCLNSSVIFSPLVASLRSVVLTSGTLSPMDVMASELNVKFAHRLEALHIIDDHQVHITSILTQILALGWSSR